MISFLVKSSLSVFLRNHFRPLPPGRVRSKDFQEKQELQFKIRTKFFILVSKRTPWKNSTYCISCHICVLWTSWSMFTDFHMFYQLKCKQLSQFLDVDEWHKKHRFRNLKSRPNFSYCYQICISRTNLSIFRILHIIWQLKCNQLSQFLDVDEWHKKRWFCNLKSRPKLTKTWWMT